MWSAPSLMDFYDSNNNTNRVKKAPVFIAPDSGPLSERLWAPELHCLRGRWYIYFAGADKAIDNRSHRIYVLGGPSEDCDPHEGPWELLGPIKAMDQGQWAIDGTVFEVDEECIFATLGWPRNPDTPSGWEEHSEKIQQLFIFRLKDPFTADGETVMISHPDNEWERLVRPGIGINEGPQWLQSPSGHWRGLVYSCSASWTKEYKMATLQYLPNSNPTSSTDGPLDPSSWVQSTSPLLQNRPDGTGPFGPGHGCFLHSSADGGETVALFHATDKDADGNQKIDGVGCRESDGRRRVVGRIWDGLLGLGTETGEVFGEGRPSGDTS